MVENIIYYGPPGTGKTYHMQQEMEKYTDYRIEDKDIEDAYTMRSQDWILITLIIMQNNNPMTASHIMSKIESLSLAYTGTVSDVLEEHSIADSLIGVKRIKPRIFLEDSGKWFVDRLKLLEYQPNFIVDYMVHGSVEKRYDFVTFHQSFAYEDFIEGIRPSYDKLTKMLDYSPKQGIFMRICEKARANRLKQYALFIDEINRGNISEIFGELISMIELDKREGQFGELEVVLPYSKVKFTVPNNLNIIGSMNSADKSIANIDLALRRRFEFVSFPCDYAVLEKELRVKGFDPNDVDGIDVVKLLKVINQRIELLLDADHVIGQAYFMKVENANDIINVITKKIVPLLEEYFFDDLQKVQMILNDIDDSGTLDNNAIYLHDELSPDVLLRFVGDYTIEPKNIYYVTSSVTKDGIVKIYDGVTL